MSSCQRYKRFAGAMRSGIGALIRSTEAMLSLSNESNCHVFDKREVKMLHEDLKSLNILTWHVDDKHPRIDGEEVETAYKCPTCRGSGRAPKDVVPLPSILREAVCEAIDFVLNEDAQDIDRIILAKLLLHCYDTQVYPLRICEVSYLSDNVRVLAWSALNYRVNGYTPKDALIDQSVFDKVIERYSDA